MVHHANLAEVRRVYEPYVGKADVLSLFQVPDTDEALRMAQLRPGENVLDLGTCSGRVIAEAKRRVGSGVCVGVDGVAGFLDVDVEARLKVLGLTRAPAGKDDKSVYLLTASVTQTNLPIRIQECVGRTAANPITFDVIFAVHVFPAIDPRHRLQALQIWKRMLAPSGRIILNMSPVFAPRSSTTQFTLDATEAPGCVFAVRYDLPKRNPRIRPDPWPKLE